jgi:TatD DNase family protein
MKANIIDTHAHLGDPIFDVDRAVVLRKAEHAGVGCVITVGETLKDAEGNINLATQHPMLKPAAGLYPAVLDENEAKALHCFIRSHCDKLVAIGEVGLDFWVVKADADKILQKEIFKSFIGLSVELDLPLNVHSRSAGRHVVSMLLEHGASKVQLHAFDGKASAALPAVEAGYFFSIPPSVVRSRQKQKLVKQLPLKNLLVESDSPVLGPSPQERNEPVNVLISIRAISEIKGIPAEAVIEAVAENSIKLYGRSILGLSPANES